MFLLLIYYFENVKNSNQYINIVVKMMLYISNSNSNVSVHTFWVTSTVCVYNAANK